LFTCVSFVSACLGQPWPRRLVFGRHCGRARERRIRILDPNR
jgi:hypothetical protein